MQDNKTIDAITKAAGESFAQLRKDELAGRKGMKKSQNGFEVSAPGSPYWVRGRARVDEDSLEIVLDEDRAQPYYLHRGEGLLFDLASLPDGDWVQNVHAFVRRYGLLWHGAPDLGSGRCREPLEDWFEEVGYLRFAMGLYRALRESVRVGSVEPLRKLELEAAWPQELVTQMIEEDFLRASHLTMVELINRGLELCVPAIGPNVELESVTPGEFSFSFLPSNLLGAAYAELAMLVGSSTEIKKCPGCGAVFSPESGKQKYCTPRCASTSRWRRWKEGQADK